MIFDFFHTGSEDNDCGMMIAGSHLFDDFDDTPTPSERIKVDVRSLALRIFEKIWQTALVFFRSPPHAYYRRSTKFFTAKLRLLHEYGSNAQIRKDIQTLSGFGREERLWIDVEHWRKMYVDKVGAYFHGQPEDWRLETAMNHSYFKNGMAIATAAPQCELREPTALLSDAALANEPTTDPAIMAEMERRNRAKEVLFLIANRWGFNVSEISGSEGGGGA